MSDTTTGATIYYTTDGTMPTPGAGATLAYNAPFTITSTSSVSAIATAPNYSTSAMATVVYTQQAVASPTISPAPGTYTSSVPVTISDATPGATIYYTTDGSTPIQGAGTTQSYPAADSLGASATVRAIAMEAGYATSAGASATYTVQTSSGGISAYSSGFTSTSGLQLNGSASWLQSANAIALTTNTNQAGSFFATTPVNVQSFTNTFSFQLPAPLSDGIVFVIQGNATTGVGGTGGALGYSVNTSQTAPFSKSVAIKFDLYNNSGEGTDSTGLYINGAPPTVPSVDMTSSGLSLSSGHVMNVTITRRRVARANHHRRDNGPIVQRPIPGEYSDRSGRHDGVCGICGWHGRRSVGAKNTEVEFCVRHADDEGCHAVRCGKPDVVEQELRAVLPDCCVEPVRHRQRHVPVRDQARRQCDDNVSVPTAGTYDVRFSTKKHNQRGIGQLSIDGVNVGSPMDQYSAADVWYETDLGNVTLTAGSHVIKLAVTGENAASTGYYLAIDTIKLLPQ